MRWLRVVPLLFLASISSAQTFDTVVAGSQTGCEPVSALFYDNRVEWIGAGLNQTTDTDILAVAPAPGGRSYAVVEVTEGRFRIAEVDPSGMRRWLTPVITGSAFGLVADRTGAFHVAYKMSGVVNSRLLTFGPDGAQRADRDLGGAYAIYDATGIAHTAIDLAADQCTLFLIRNGRTVARFDACTGTFLPDFGPLQSPQVFALRVLPDGGILASVWGTGRPSQVERYAADGTFVRAYPVGTPGALMLADGGTRLIYGRGECFVEPFVITMDLATGTTESSVPLTLMNTPKTIVARNGWTAAIGATHANAIPTADTVALAVIAMLIGAAAMFRLR